MFCLDAPRGFEPRSGDSKSLILPLDEGAIISGVLFLRSATIRPADSAAYVVVATVLKRLCILLTPHYWCPSASNLIQGLCSPWTTSIFPTVDNLLRGFEPPSPTFTAGNLTTCPQERAPRVIHQRGNAFGLHISHVHLLEVVAATFSLAGGDGIEPPKNKIQSLMHHRSATSPNDVLMTPHGFEPCLSTAGLEPAARSTLRGRRPTWVDVNFGA